MADTDMVDVLVTWTLLAEGQQDGLVQLREIGVAEIFVGSAAPADDANKHGPVIDSGGSDGAFSWSGLTATDNVYGRSLSDKTLPAAVMTLPVPA